MLPGLAMEWRTRRRLEKLEVEQWNRATEPIGGPAGLLARLHCRRTSGVPKVSSPFLHRVLRLTAFPQLIGKQLAQTRR